MPTETRAACNAITSLYDLVPGDHIKTNSNWDLLYDHHMIVVEVKRIRIIHKRRDQEAVVEEEVSCYKPRDLTLLVYDSPFSGVEIVRRARERIGQSYYNLVFANCEHFVTEGGQ